MNYFQSLQYLYSFIPQKQLLHTGEKGILRTKYLLHLLGNPQEKLKVIHIAGTSGKGSTAYVTSILLKEHGFRVGLQVSPHLLDIRERFQINNELIRKEEFTQFVAGIMPYVEKAKETKWGRLSFFEIGVCLAFYIFAKKKINYAVIETGLGGLFDGTNVVENPSKLSIITRIGLDHQKVLGNTLSLISYQKAGIIKKGNTVITVQQIPTVMNIFYRTVKLQNAHLIMIQKEQNYRNIILTKNGTVFDYQYKDICYTKLQTKLIGSHQVENISIVLTTLYELHLRGHFQLNESKVRLGLQNAYFKGRCEILQTKNRDIIIDGAHNPQKMKAFISTIIKLYPKNKFDFLISFSEGKNQVSTMRGMLKQIVPIAHSMIITNFILEGQDTLHHSVESKRITDILEKLNFTNYLCKDFNQNFSKEVLSKNKRPLVITGSLYLIGSIYEHLKNASPFVIK